jgi:hypothetical protein
LALVELANSSLHTSVPDAMLGVKLLLATLLAVLPEAVAMAFTVRFEATRNGASYICDDVLGAEPSSVK